MLCAYASTSSPAFSPAPTTNATPAARARLLIPDELLERPDLSLERAARALRVPAAELRDAQADGARPTDAGGRLATPVSA
jgi:hypothetical protein